MADYKDAADVAARLQPHHPVFCARPQAAGAAARVFLEQFPGETFYAVKANPVPWLLRSLYEAGVRRFEVASINEVRLIASLFADADIAFMNPVKPEEAIAEAYHRHGVRIFALDTVSEIEKILRATGDATDLTLCLRHAVSGEGAQISLTRKYGIDGDDAVGLLQRMRARARRLGVAFHVGSQAMSPAAFAAAMDAVERTIVRAGVIVDVVNVGGGFPCAYPGMTPPPLSAYFDVIRDRFETMLVTENCALWCEPGRALCADAASLLVRVEGRKGDDLYINDGAYGALFDAAHLNWPFPARAVRAGRVATGDTAPFSFYGPTCDDLDHMPGPFTLPADISVGAYIEIGRLGAYGEAMATRFNGVGGPYKTVHVADAADAHLTTATQEEDEEARYGF